METLDRSGVHPEGDSSYWRCPKCGSTLERDMGVANQGATVDTATCSKCGAELEQGEVYGGNQELDPRALNASGKAGRNPMALVVVALVAAGMLYFGFHMAHRPGGSTSSLVKSKVAPDFTLESLEGKNVRLSDLRGKAVLLNFWATWCSPCKIEMPWFVELQNQYGAQGLQIVGVAMDDASKQDIAKFARDMGVNYPILIGKESIGDDYGGVPALPESFFIGRDGKMVDKIIGLKGKSEIEESIKKALNTQPANSQAQGVPVPTTQAQK